MTLLVKTAIIINLSAVEQQKIAGRTGFAGRRVQGAMNLLSGRFCAWKNSNGGVFYSLVQVCRGGVWRETEAGNSPWPGKVGTVLINRRNNEGGCTALTLYGGTSRFLNTDKDIERPGR
jgi:hypothetical protein